MAIMKKVSIGLTAGLLAIGLMGGVASPSFAITSPSQVASATNTQSNIVTEIQVIEGK